MKKLLCCGFLIFLSGCAGFGQLEDVSELSSEQLKALRSIETYEQDIIKPYETLGRIKGLSCKGSAFSGDTSQAAAMTQLKIKAVKLEANGILYPTCVLDNSVDWGNNCWESWVCVGDAVLVED